ncbi:MAG: hypothetical protein JF603_12695, partial [Acidobacteria bacterium]|nr:hypothetical protein [Acidobacteriota bacterium]
MPDNPLFSHAGTTALFSHAAASPPPAFEPAVQAEAAGEATPEQVALLEGEPALWRRTVERLLAEVEESLHSVKANGGLDAEEREQIVADFEDERLDLARALARLGGPPVEELIEAPAEVRLQASWAAGKVVVWAGGRGAKPADGEELADRLEAAGAPAEGWDVHPAVVLPTGERADALSLPVGDGLGWLVALGAGQDVEHVGASVAWLGRIAVW